MVVAVNAEHDVIVIVGVDNEPMHNNNTTNKKNGMEDFIMAVFVVTMAGIVVTLSYLVVSFVPCLCLKR